MTPLQAATVAFIGGWVGCFGAFGLGILRDRDLDLVPVPESVLVSTMCAIGCAGFAGVVTFWLQG